MQTLARLLLDFAIGLSKGLFRFNRDDGWAIASHMTLSGILALFPFLIFCAALAAFFDLGEFSETVVHLAFDIWPQSVAGPLASEVSNVLTVPRGDVLTIGAALALFFASSGVEALRLGLNRAYRVPETRNVIRLRLQSILFVLVAAATIATVAVLLVILPLAWNIARRYLPWLDDYRDIVSVLRLSVSALIVIAALFASHKWLPAGRRSLVELIPGVGFTLVVWLAAAITFGAYLERFADYVGTYAGLAGIMVALVFLYIMSAIFLIGAELNNALARLKAGAHGAAAGPAA